MLTQWFIFLTVITLGKGGVALSVTPLTIPSRFSTETACNAAGEKLVDLTTKQKMDRKSVIAYYACIPKNG